MIKKIIKKILRFFGLNNLINFLYNIKENLFNFDKKSVKSNFIKFNERVLGKDKDLIFDIGANIGDYTDLYLNLGSKRIISIEPQKKIFDILKKRFENNKRVIPIQVGIGSKKGELEIFISDEDHSVSTFSKKQTQNSRLKENIEWNRKEIVKIITIESLIKKYGIPSFVKIDVEGFELEIFRGLKTKIPKFQFEFLKKENLEDLLKIFYLIDNLGNYEYNMISNLSANKLLFNNFVDSNFFLNFIENFNDFKIIGDYLAGDIIVRLKK